MKILITGATGLIGRKLSIDLMKDGHEVSALVRSPKSVSFLPQKRLYSWTDDKVPPSQAIVGQDVVIHLAGENIAARWTKARKKRIYESRIFGTSNIVEAIQNLKEGDRPKILICASAIGLYGSSGEEEVFEDHEPADGFLARLCVAWEREANKASQFGVRVINTRFGIVLAKEGGALSKMGPFILGSGQQWMSWVHIDDIVGFVKHAIKTQSLAGAYNLTSPHPVRQIYFVRTLKHVRNLHLALTVPKWILSLALGEMAQVILGSQKVLPRRALESGYRFKFPELNDALESLLKTESHCDQTFSAEQFIENPREKIVSFFSRAENLEELTPPWLNFRIVSSSSAQIEQGSIIDYCLNIHGWPVRWKTLISQWKPPQSFIDEQLSGPYRKWHHVHCFHQVSGDTLLTDHITYRIPFSWVGKLLLSRWIARDVKNIFEFRKTKISEFEKEGRFS